MSSTDSWLSSLSNHAIFTLPSSPEGGEAESSSSSTASFAGKRNTMVVRGGDLVVAVGKEVRMCSLGDVKSGGRVGYKVSSIDLNGAGGMGREKRRSWRWWRREGRGPATRLFVRVQIPFDLTKRTYSGLSMSPFSNRVTWSETDSLTLFPSLPPFRR